MNVEEFREYCLSLPDVTEATPFEKFSKGKFTILGRPVLTVVFYINSHMFCYFNVDDFSNITIKCESSEMAELKEHYQAVSEPFNGDKRYWISVQPNMDIHDEELKELVRKSYESQAQKPVSVIMPGCSASVSNASLPTCLSTSSRRMPTSARMAVSTTSHITSRCSKRIGQLLIATICLRITSKSQKLLERD